MRSFRVSSVVAAPPSAVWARVSTLDGVNDELWPVVRMTRPARADHGLIRPGALGRSWLLLGGVLPFDADDLVLEAVEPERGFRERSRLLSAPAWHHDRTLRPIGDGACRVADTVRFCGRVPALEGLQAFAFEATFRWRHRRLRRRFGSAADRERAPGAVA